MDPPRKPVQIKSKSKHLKQMDENEICSETLLTAELSYLLSQKPNVISFGHTLASGAMLGYVTAHISNNFLNVFSPAAYLWAWINFQPQFAHFMPKDSNGGTDV